MEKNLRNVTNISCKPQAERIRQIEQKLQYISQAKSAQQQEQKAINSHTKAANTQKYALQTLKKYDVIIKQQKQQLKQASRQYEESKSHQDLLLRNRALEINQVQTRLKNIWKVQLQRSRENQKKLIMAYEQKIENLRASITKETEKRKQYFCLLDSELAQKLPGLQNQIMNKIKISSQYLLEMQNQIEGQSQKICLDIKQSQKKHFGSFEQLMKMMGSVIVQVKEQIANQKQSRTLNKKKLVSLFEGAFSKIVA